MSPPYFSPNTKRLHILKNNYQKHSKDYKGWIIYQEQQTWKNQKEGVEVYSEKEVKGDVHTYYRHACKSFEVREVVSPRPNLFLLYANVIARVNKMQMPNKSSPNWHHIFILITTAEKNVWDVTVIFIHPSIPSRSWSKELNLHCNMLVSKHKYWSKTLIKNKLGSITHKLRRLCPWKNLIKNIWNLFSIIEYYSKFIVLTW